MMEVIAILHAVAQLLKVQAAAMLQQPALDPVAWAHQQGQVARLRAVALQLEAEAFQMAAAEAAEKIQAVTQVNPPPLDQGTLATIDPTAPLEKTLTVKEILEAAHAAAVTPTVEETAKPDEGVLSSSDVR